MSNAKLGEKNNFYGRRHTEESIQKMRDAHLGKKLSAEHRKRVVDALNPSGENNVNAMLTDEIVNEIRQEYNSLEKKRGFAARKSRELGVSYSCIDRVIKNETWKHLL